MEKINRAVLILRENIIRIQINVMDNICLISGKNKPTTYLSFLAWIPESLKYQYAPNSTLIANQESIF